MVRNLKFINENENLNVMKLKIIIFSLLFGTIILSCKKVDLSDAGKPGNSGNNYVAILSKVLIDNQSAYEYQYNDSSMVTQVKSKYDFTTHHYNSKGLLTVTESYGNDDLLSSDIQVYQAAINRPEWVTPANGKKGGTISYEYNSAKQLVKTIHSRPSSTSSEYSLFIYNSSNRITRQTMYWENIATGYIEYTYDTKGNLIKEMLYNLPSSGVAELITFTQYTFDNEPNPFKSTSRLMTPGVNTNTNNIIKESYTIHITPDQGSDKVQITETSYQYNGMGYPITRNGNVSYIYK